MSRPSAARTLWLAESIAPALTKILIANGVTYVVAVVVHQWLNDQYHPAVRLSHVAGVVVYALASFANHRRPAPPRYVTPLLGLSLLFNVLVQALFLRLDPVPQTLVPSAIIALTTGLAALDLRWLVVNLGILNLANLIPIALRPGDQWIVPTVATVAVTLLAIALWILRNAAADALLAAQAASEEQRRAAERALETLEAEQLQNQQLRRRISEREKLESLGLMAGGIAHDFNNLLTPILTSAELLAEEIADHPSAADDCTSILQAGLRARELAEQLLAYAGRRNRPRQDVELSSAIQSAAALLRSSLPRGIALTWRCEPQLHARVAPSDLQQIVTNLVLNAAEAIQESTGEGCVQVSVGSAFPDAGQRSATTPPLPASEHGWIRLRVEDDGPGLDQEIAHRILDPFFTTKTRGTGLGLATVLGCSQAAGGGVHFGSGETQGTWFHVYLPRQDSYERRRVTSPRRSARSDLGGKRVLVIDDEPECRASAQRALDSLSMNATCYSNGREATAALREEQFDLVLLDLQMPDWDGERTHREIRRHHTRLPVLICSGYDKGQARRLLRSDPRTRHLAKPYRICELGDAIHSLVAEIDSQAIEVPDGLSARGTAGAE